MNYARLSSENTVIEVFTPPAPFTLEECFTPEIVAQFEPCPDEVEQNWIKQEDGTFVAPPPPEPAPEPTIEDAAP
jgi:hypothetical protein